MRKPKLKYLVAGLQKAGTTSVHDALSKSKNFNLPYDKELVDFFSVLDPAVRSVETLFTSVATQFAIVSPTAGCSELFLQNVRQEFDVSDVKVFMLWRNSEDRVRSHLKMLLRRGDLAPDLQAVSMRLQEDFRMYVQERGGAGGSIDGSDLAFLENVFRNSCITTYVRVTKEVLGCKDDQISIVTVDEVFSELGLSSSGKLSNDSSRVKRFDYQRLFQVLKKIKGLSAFFKFLPRSIKSYIFWQLQTRYSIVDPGLVERIVNEALDTSEYAAIFDCLDRAAAERK